QIEVAGTAEAALGRAAHPADGDLAEGLQLELLGEGLVDAGMASAAVEDEPADFFASDLGLHEQVAAVRFLRLQGAGLRRVEAGILAALWRKLEGLLGQLGGLLDLGCNDGGSDAGGRVRPAARQPEAFAVAEVLEGVGVLLIARLTLG